MFKIKTIVFILFIAFMACGCMNVTCSVKIEEDGSGVIGYRFVTEPTFAEMIKSQRIISGRNNPTVKDEIVNGEFHHIEYAFFENLNKLMMIEKDIRVRKIEKHRFGKDLIRFEYLVDIKEDDQGMADLLAGFYFKLILKLPGKIENIHPFVVDNIEVKPSVEGNKVTWKVPLNLIFAAKNKSIAVDFSANLKVTDTGSPKQPETDTDSGLKSESGLPPVIDADQCYLTFFNIESPVTSHSGGKICVGWTDECAAPVSTNHGDTLTEDTNCFSLKNRNGPYEDVTIRTKSPGGYLYRQKLVVNDDPPRINSRAKANIEKMVARYAPILEFSEIINTYVEKYYPMSLDTVFDKALGDNETGASYVSIDSDAFGDVWFGSSTDKTKWLDASPGKELGKKLMAFRGSSNSMIAFNGLPLTQDKIKNAYHVHATYKIYPNNELSISYWFFYGFDPKQKKVLPKNITNYAVHHGDWEMITILFKNCSSSYASAQPYMVGFSEHLDTQIMTCLYGDCARDFNGTLKKGWGKPGLALPWDLVEKNDDHVLVYVAMGSHASYPRRGFYSINGLPEKAGGGKELRPEEYKINILPRMGEVTSNHEYGWLLFAGSVRQGSVGPFLHNIILPPYQKNKWLDPREWVRSLTNPTNSAW